ncbi:MAG: helix-turn-helix transcriptional regulator [Bosea sp.]|uniref:helix-turn-helix domain-containing protein n=1 Tax=Bosea sp. (in: a-proteobacteria) TaxID=1871050 RepID=UPI0023A62C20|nr:helix-turn-helix transcriptional regulator [Bosea sp. (in: a-proteobacteria)]MCP4732734.1 helix-turn-helix transcriptional regulator [Bosea sp. (in: a-proteobacteria)]
MNAADAAAGFRQRLQSLIDGSGLNQAAFARMAEIDRSTLSQLLSADGPRMPRADTLIALAQACQVSVDWLLGLTPRKEVGTQIIDSIMQIQTHTRSPIDDHFLGWLREVEGYRVRTVPDSLPDFLKTEEVLRFEYQGASLNNVASSFGARLALMRRPESELEVCTSIQALTTMAKGEGKWEGLNKTARRRQLEHFGELYAELYPSLRIYFYTLTETYSNPFTVFGPKRVTLFLGTSYLVLNGIDYVRLFSKRFDELIKLAVVQPHQIAQTLDDVLSELG